MDSSTYLIARDRAEQDAALSRVLSAVQQQLCACPPVPCQLAAVLTAAAPAWQAGLCYVLTYWPGEVRVTLRHGAAEIDSRALVDDATDIQAVAARLLAGLVGLALESATAPQPTAPEPAAAPEPAEPAAAPPAAVTPEPAAPPAAAPQPAGPEPRQLSAEEISAAVEMIRCMPADVRKAFSQAFRSTFAVPAEAKVITPHITTSDHLLFIDRFTVEAAGGIVAA
jgi:hypothetical protein